MITAAQKAWLVAAQSSELKKKPLSVTICNTRLVLFRVNQRVVCLRDRCSHRNVPLSAGRVMNGTIECPYHGWQFDGTGTCAKIPGRSCDKAIPDGFRVPSFQTYEAHGMIWVYLGEGTPPEKPYLPAFCSKPSTYFFTWKTTAQGTLLNLIENFLDGTHTHFVHAGLIRTEGKRQEVHATLRKTATTATVCYTNEGKQSGIISRLFEAERSHSYGRFVGPNIAEIEYCSSKGTTLLISAAIVPVTETEHTIFATIALKKRWWIPNKLQKLLITPFLKLGLRQDQKIVRLQHETITTAGEERFVSTELDIIRAAVQQILKGNEKEYEKKVTLYL